MQGIDCLPQFLPIIDFFVFKLFLFIAKNKVKKKIVNENEFLHWIIELYQFISSFFCEFSKKKLKNFESNFSLFSVSSHLSLSSITFQDVAIKYTDTDTETVICRITAGKREKSRGRKEGRSFVGAFLPLNSINNTANIWYITYRLKIQWKWERRMMFAMNWLMNESIELLIEFDLNRIELNWTELHKFSLFANFSPSLASLTLSFSLVLDDQVAIEWEYYNYHKELLFDSHRCLHGFPCQIYNSIALFHFISA